MAAKPIPESIREVLRYDPETGEFWRKCKQTPHQGGYLSIGYKRRTFFAHRLAYFLMTGRQPNVIDHINRCKHDNRWENLRNVTLGQNAANTCVFRDGVHLNRDGYFEARIQNKGIVHKLYFGKDCFEAYCLRKSAENRLHKISL